MRQLVRQLRRAAKTVLGIRGKAQEALWNHLVAFTGEDWMSINDMAQRPAFRGIHYKKIQQAAKVLATQGLIEFRNLHEFKRAGVGDIKLIEPTESDQSKTRKTKRIKQDDEPEE